MKLHPKILELQKKIGTTPFVRSANYPINIELRKANSETTDRTIKAYHCIWGEIDDRGTRWVKGCFKRSIDERGPKSSAKYKITYLWMHDMRDPIGLPSTIEEKEIGLYAECTPDDVPNGDRAVTQVRSGTINNFSFGFKPMWDKMEYNSDDDCVDIYEAELLELSPVTAGGNMNTYAVRGINGEFEDQYLIEETDDFIRSLPRKQQLEARQLIDRHITLARNTQNSESSEVGSNAIDYEYLLNNLKNS